MSDQEDSNQTSSSTEGSASSPRSSSPPPALAVRVPSPVLDGGRGDEGGEVPIAEAVARAATTDAGGGGEAGGAGGAGGAAGGGKGNAAPRSSLTDDPLVKKWLEEKDIQTKDRVEENKIRERNRRYTLGACYLLAMGVCGIVLVALGSTLNSIAENCGTTATAVGVVFVTRGAGAIFGAVCSAKLYERFEGNYVISVALFSLGAILVYMPWINHVWELHLCFGLLGICTAITDTGCQIMTRFVHGPKAGPWLGANTVSFGISGAIVPVVSYITSVLYVQYLVLASLAVIGSVTLLSVGTSGVRKPPSHHSGGSRGGHFNWREFKTELITANMVFWLIGGKVTATAFLESYVEDTGVLPTSDEALVILVLWVAITAGRILGVVDQTFIDTGLLYNHLTLFLVGGVLAFALILILPYNGAALWVGVGAYGFFNGPTVGYCYDLVNRLTVPSEVGMSIVMFGLNFGASLVPYVSSLIWDAGAGPSTLTVTVFLSMLIPLPLLYLTKIWRNEKHVYLPVPTLEQAEEEKEGREQGVVVDTDSLLPTATV